MIEEQLRDGLRAAVTQEPPLGFDPDELADTARRTAYRRRTAWATTAVAAIVAVGAIGAVATFGRAGGGPAVEPGHRGGGMTEVSAENDVRDLGNSLTEALSTVEPKARGFEVIASQTSAAGVVMYDVAGKPAALAYWVRDCEPVARVDGCGYTSVHNHLQELGAGTVRIASVAMDGVLLNVATGDRMPAVEATTGILPTKLKQCACLARDLSPLSEQQLTAVVEYGRLKLFDPGDTENTHGELKQRLEEERQTELEAEAYRLKLEAEVAARKTGGK